MFFVRIDLTLMFSDSGGGGERVLWSAIAYLQASQKDVVSMVYTGDFPAGGSEADKAKIIHNVKVRFNLSELSEQS